jgi:uncharacterized repeat protein (TIGR02543 family)
MKMRKLSSLLLAFVFLCGGITVPTATAAVESDPFALGFNATLFDDFLNSTPVQDWGGGNASTNREHRATGGRNGTPATFIGMNTTRNVWTALMMNGNPTAIPANAQEVWIWFDFTGMTGLTSNMTVQFAAPDQNFCFPTGGNYFIEDGLGGWTSRPFAAGPAHHGVAGRLALAQTDIENYKGWIRFPLANYPAWPSAGVATGFHALNLFYDQTVTSGTEGFIIGEFYVAAPKVPSNPFALDFDTVEIESFTRATPPEDWGGGNSTTNREHRATGGRNGTPATFYGLDTGTKGIWADLQIGASPAIGADAKEVWIWLDFTGMTLTSNFSIQFNFPGPVSAFATGGNYLLEDGAGGWTARPFAAGPATHGVTDRLGLLKEDIANYKGWVRIPVANYPLWPVGGAAGLNSLVLFYDQEVTGSGPEGFIIGEMHIATAASIPPPLADPLDVPGLNVELLHAMASGLTAWGGITPAHRAGEGFDGGHAAFVGRDTTAADRADISLRVGTDPVPDDAEEIWIWVDFSGELTLTHDIIQVALSDSTGSFGNQFAAIIGQPYYLFENNAWVQKTFVASGQGSPWYNGYMRGQDILGYTGFLRIPLTSFPDADWQSTPRDFTDGIYGISFIYGQTVASGTEGFLIGDIYVATPGGTVGFTGSFIQDWHARGRNQTWWNNEMAAMKEAGLDTLIIQSSVTLTFAATPARSGGTSHTDHAPTGATALFPFNTTNSGVASVDNLPNTGQRTQALEFALRAARTHGMKVMVGLGYDSREWLYGSNANDLTQPAAGMGSRWGLWTAENAELNAEVAKQIWALYGANGSVGDFTDVIAGWYYVNEWWNFSQFSAAVQAHSLNGVLNWVQANTPALPVMMSPFTNFTARNAEQTGQMYQDIFALTNWRAHDIFAPQCSTGVHPHRLPELEAWLTAYKGAVDNAVSAGVGMRYWVNIENFTPVVPGQTDRGLVGAEMRRLAQQIDIASEFASKIVTFSWNHYFRQGVSNNLFGVSTPNDPRFDANYQHWRETGEILPPPELELLAPDTLDEDREWGGTPGPWMTTWRSSGSTGPLKETWFTKDRLRAADYILISSDSRPTGDIQPAWNLGTPGPVISPSGFVYTTADKYEFAVPISESWIPTLLNGLSGTLHFLCLDEADKGFFAHSNTRLRLVNEWDDTEKQKPVVVPMPEVDGLVTSPLVDFTAAPDDWGFAQPASFALVTNAGFNSGPAIRFRNPGTAQIHSMFTPVATSAAVSAETTEIWVWVDFTGVTLTNNVTFGLRTGGTFAGGDTEDHYTGHGDGQVYYIQDGSDGWVQHPFATGNAANSFAYRGGMGRTVLEGYKGFVRLPRASFPSFPAGDTAIFGFQFAYDQTGAGDIFIGNMFTAAPPAEPTNYNWYTVTDFTVYDPGDPNALPDPIPPTVPVHTWSPTPSAPTATAVLPHLPAGGYNGGGAIWANYTGTGINQMWTSVNLSGIDIPSEAAEATHIEIWLDFTEVTLGTSPPVFGIGFRRNASDLNPIWVLPNAPFEMSADGIVWTDRQFITGGDPFWNFAGGINTAHLAGFKGFIRIPLSSIGAFGFGDIRPLPPGTFDDGIHHISFLYHQSLSSTPSGFSIGRVRLGVPTFTPPPTFSPNGGSFVGSTTVTISAPNATIFYTLDGSDPAWDGTDPTGTTVLYTGPIPLSETTTIKAFAVRPGRDDSQIAAAGFTRVLPPPPPPPPEFDVTVSGVGTGGTASGRFVLGAVVSIDAGVREGFTFAGWTGGVVFADADSVSTTFTMPGNNVTVTATWDVIPVDESEIQRLIAGAIAEADEDETPTVILDFTESAALDADAVLALADAEVALTVVLPAGELTLDPEALALLAEAAEDGDTVTIVITHAPAEDLQDMQTEQLKGLDTVVFSVDVFVGGVKFDIPATVKLPFTLKPDQDPKGVRAWYMDDRGYLICQNGVFDPDTGYIIFTIKHQSYFVVGFDPVALWVNPFSDLSEDHRYYDSIAFVNIEGLMIGHSDSNRFAPDDTFTRAEFATVIWRLAGRPRPAGTASFPDVLGRHWHYDQVIWAAESGIVQGRTNGRFDPNDPVTRQEAATMLHRYAEFMEFDLPEIRPMPVYTDIDSVWVWAETPVRELAQAGVLRAYSQFRPRDNTLRGEAADMFRNFVRFVVEDIDPLFVDGIDRFQIITNFSDGAPENWWEGDEVEPTHAPGRGFNDGYAVFLGRASGGSSSPTLMIESTVSVTDRASEIWIWADFSSLTLETGVTIGFNTYEDEQLYRYAAADRTYYLFIGGRWVEKTFAPCHVFAYRGSMAKEDIEGYTGFIRLPLSSYTSYIPGEFSEGIRAIRLFYNQTGAGGFHIGEIRAGNRPPLAAPGDRFKLPKWPARIDFPIGSYLIDGYLSDGYWDHENDPPYTMETIANANFLIVVADRRPTEQVLFQWGEFMATTVTINPVDFVENAGKFEFGIPVNRTNMPGLDRDSDTFNLMFFTADRGIYNLFLANEWN